METEIVSLFESPIYARIPRGEHVMKKSVATAQMASQVAPNCALVRAYEELAGRLSACREVTAEAEARPGLGFVTRLPGSLGARV